MAKKHRDIEDEEIVRLYEQDRLSCSAIAEQFGVSESTIQRRLKKHTELRQPNEELKRMDVIEQTQEIIRLYTAEKLSTRELAARYQTTKTLINRLLANNGVQLQQRNTYPDLDRATLERLYVDERLSLRKIAELFGCSSTVVGKRMKAYGIRTRKEMNEFTAAERKAKYGKQKEGHHLWKGGITPVHTLVRNRLGYLSRERFELDRFRCQVCKSNKNLHAHHKRHFAEIISEILAENTWVDLQDEQLRMAFVELCETEPRLLDLENLVTLCEACHSNEHTENPVEVVNHDILEAAWRTYVDKNHFIRSVYEMKKDMERLYGEIRSHRIIRYMKSKNYPFAYENKDWLEKKVEETGYSYIAREFHSRTFPCKAEDIKDSARRLGIIPDHTLSYIDHYKQGWSLKKIAAHYRTSARAVADSLRGNGIDVKNKRLRDDLDPKEIARLYEAGLSKEAIRKQMGCSLQTVSAILSRMGHQSSRSPSAELDVDEQGIVQAYTEHNKPIHKIAKERSLPIRTVGRILDKHNVDRTKYKERVNVDTEELKRLHGSGKSVREMASVFGVSESIIYARLKKHKIGLQLNKEELLHYRLAEVARLCKEGKKRSEIAAELSISEATVTKYSKMQGIKIQNPIHRSDIDPARINGLYSDGKTVKEIAELFDCTAETIRKHIKTKKPQLQDKLSKAVLTDLLTRQQKGYKEIAELFGTSRGAVWRLKEKYGIAVPPKR